MKHNDVCPICGTYSLFNRICQTHSEFNITPQSPTPTPPEPFDMEQFLDSPTCQRCHCTIGLNDGCEWPDDHRLLLCGSCVYKFAEELLPRSAPEPVCEAARKARVRLQLRATAITAATAAKDAEIAELKRRLNEANAQMRDFDRLKASLINRDAKLATLEAETARLRERDLEMTAMLAKIKRDYSHAWPGEDKVTREYRIGTANDIAALLDPATGGNAE